MNMERHPSIRACPRGRSLVHAPVRRPWPCLLAMLLAGCIQTDQQLVLRDDGSGRFTVQYAAPLPADAGEGAAATALWDPAAVRADFRRYEPYGVHLQSVEIREEDGWQRLDLSVTFTSLNGLLKTAFFAERTLSLRRNTNGDYVLTLVRAPEQAATGNRLDLGHLEAEAAGDGTLKGFRATFEIEVPGAPIEHNGDSLSGRRVRWAYSGETDTNVLRRVRDAYFRVVFDGTDLRIPEIGSMHMRLPGPVPASGDASR